MNNKTDVLQGTPALMVLKTPDVLGPLHGYGIARRIEQISGDLLNVNRKARFYGLTGDGRKQLQAETRSREKTAPIIARFFAAKAEDPE